MDEPMIGCRLSPEELRAVKEVLEQEEALGHLDFIYMVDKKGNER